MILEETISIKDGISGPARSAADELMVLSSALTKAQDKMTLMSALGNNKGLMAAKKDVTALQSAISTLPPAHDAAAASAVGMQAPIKDTGKAFAGAADAMRVGKEVIGAAIEGVKGAVMSLANGDIQGALSSVTTGVAGIAKSLDLLVPGLGEVAAAAVQAAGGLASLAVGGMKTAIEVGTLEKKMTSMFDALGEGQISGAQVMGMLDDMSNSLGLTREQIAPLTKEFMAMGVHTEAALKQMTTAALSAQAIMGDASASEAYVTMARKIQAAGESGQALKIKLAELSKMGVDTADVAARLGISATELGAKLKAGSVDANKFGKALQEALIEKGAGPLSEMGNELGNIWGKFGQDMKAMFKGIDFGPFLAAVKDLFSIFDTGKTTATETGKAMHAGIVGAMQGIFAAATKVIPMLKHGFLDIEIFVLKAYIALKPIGAAILKFAGASSFVDMISNAFSTLGGYLETAGQFLKPLADKFIAFITSATGTKIITTILGALVTAFKVAAVVIGVVVGLGLALLAWTVGCAAMMGVLIGKFFEFGASVITSIGSAFDWAQFKITSWIQDRVADFLGLKDMLSTLAGDIIKGLVDGITNGAGAVAGAVTGIAGKAKDAFKGALGIASPSKVMFEAGDVGVAGGVAAGVTAGTSDVTAASKDMAKAAAAPMMTIAPQINAMSLSAGTPDLSSAFSGGVKTPTPPPAPSAPAAAGGSGGTTVVFEAGSITINGADKSLEEITDEALADAFERAAQHAGVT